MSQSRVTTPDTALQEVTFQQRGGSCTMVVFGGSGDLAKRKIFPAIFSALRNGKISEKFSIIGAGLPVMQDDQYRELIGKALKEFVPARHLDPNILKKFLSHLFYVGGGFDEDPLYTDLKSRLSQVAKDRGALDNRLYYLATPPSLFAIIVQKLGAHNMATVAGTHQWRRIIVEKPIGRDLQSARALNAEIGKVFQEWQIYRIDHYLGKETVQNILAFRFGNGIFEPLWNRNYIDYIQITAAETVGVEQRGVYYEEAGALRDMVQNHLLQVMALIAMEPPGTFDANAVRDESVKVLRAIRPLVPADVDRNVVRGQYRAGEILGAPVAGYREEPHVAEHSITPTYIAARFLVDNWRWDGVPFYIRTGKRMPQRMTEIVIEFRRTPHLMFSREVGAGVNANRLIIRVQPDEGISLGFEAKYPGPAMRLESVDMDFSYAESFETKTSDAYERLILDCLQGDATLFMRKDAVEVAWWLMMPILEHWAESKTTSIPTYAAGTWGPWIAKELLSRDEHCWRLD